MTDVYSPVLQLLETAAKILVAASSNWRFSLLLSSGPAAIDLVNLIRSVLGLRAADQQSSSPPRRRNSAVSMWGGGDDPPSSGGSADVYQPAGSREQDFMTTVFSPFSDTISDFLHTILATVWEIATLSRSASAAQTQPPQGAEASAAASPESQASQNSSAAEGTHIISMLVEVVFTLESFRERERLLSAKSDPRGFGIASGSASASGSMFPPLPSLLHSINTAARVEQAAALLLDAPDWQAARAAAVASTVSFSSQLQLNAGTRVAHFTSKQRLAVVSKEAAEALAEAEVAANAQLRGAVIKRLCEEERECLAATTALRLRQRKLRMKKWQVVLRHVTNERGPWSLYGGLPESDRPRVYWMLDESETNSRMRMRLKINYEGSDHRSASLEQGRTFERTAVPTLQETETKQLLSLSRLLLSPAHSESEADTVTIQEVDDYMHAVQEGQAAVLDEAVAPDSSKAPVAEVIERDYSIFCTRVSVYDTFPGLLTITSSVITFEAKPVTPPGDVRRMHSGKNISLGDSAQLLHQQFHADKRILLSSVRAVHNRRYQLQRTALELYLLDNSTIFFHFKSQKERDTVLEAVLSRLQRVPEWRAPRGAGVQPKSARWHPDHVAFSRMYPQGVSPMDVIRKSGIPQAWRQRRMSNFDYLMHLNTIAGRTYNDLTQWPVFPWIIADYKSTTLDLNNPATYRDLSKPIGALNPNRLRLFIDRYNGFEDDSMPKFFYGTHYSSSGVVLYYLLRLEPFTSLAIQLQDGKFDHPDRMFFSLARTWEGVLNNPADVKELVPEFFYLPEMFRNENNFLLGTKQTGQALGDVELPPWASSPEEFVRLNRLALESPYVSAHLHEWVDLIFGHKQQGPAAEEAYNVFFHMTYEGNVDMTKIEDPQIRDATISQIQHFGQTPSQLFTTPHAPRYKQEEHRHLGSILHQLNDVQMYEPLQINFGSAEPAVPLVFIDNCADRIITLGLNRCLAIHKWKGSTSEYVPPFAIDIEKRSGKPRRLGVHFDPNLKIMPYFFAVSHCEKYIISCGHWDNSIRVSHMETGELASTLLHHKDIVTCAALSERGDFLVTGSRDTTVMVWAVGDSQAIGSDYIVQQPLHILYGHDDDVTCVAVSSDFDILASCSRDG